MDDQSKTELDRILALESAALTKADKAFLKARSSYIPEHQKSVFADVLGDEEVSEEADQEPEPDEGDPKPTKSRKAKGE